jgi:hypothetical protein
MPAGMFRYGRNFTLCFAYTDCMLLHTNLSRMTSCNEGSPMRRKTEDSGNQLRRNQKARISRTRKQRKVRRKQERVRRQLEGRVIFGVSRARMGERVGREIHCNAVEF